MGIFDVYCFICGNPAHGLKPDKAYEHIDTNCYEKITKWMDMCTILTASGEIYHNAREVAGTIVFKTKKNNNLFFLSQYSTKFELNRCVFCHTDCYKYIKNKFNVKLDYSMLTVQLGGHSLTQIDADYDFITEYYRQMFEFQNVIDDKKSHVLYSPLKSISKNLSRIDKIFRQFKIKKGRKGPNISATLVKNNTIRIGNDNKFWQNKNNKWIKLPIKPKLKIIKYNPKNKNHLEKLSSLPQFYESYNPPSSKSDDLNNILFVKLNNSKSSATSASLILIGTDNSVSSFTLQI